MFVYQRVTLFSILEASYNLGFHGVLPIKHIRISLRTGWLMDFSRSISVWTLIAWMTSVSVLIEYIYIYTYIMKFNPAYGIAIM